MESTHDLPATRTVNGKTTTAAGAKLTTVTTDTAVDAWGNPTNITMTTRDHANGKRFRRVTANSYGSTDDSQRYGRLTAATVTRQRDLNGDGDYGDRHETLTRKSAFSYYASGAHRRLLRTETLAPDDPRLKHETTHHYDAFGNRVRAVVRAAAAASGGVTGTRCNVDTAQYDTHGRYVVREWDCLGRARRALSGHNGWGQPVTVKQFLDTDDDDDDDNNPARTTTHTYTPGGWLTVSREPTGAHTGQYRAGCARSDAHCPAGTAYVMATRQAGGGRQWAYRDRLDRVIRTRADGFKQDTWILTDTEYDALGRVARQSEPYYAGETAYWTTYGYDLLGRVTKTTLPDYATDSNDAVTHNSVITMAYAGFTTTTTNGEGQKHTKTRNALGEVIKSADNNGTPVTHTHDAWGQVIETATGAGPKPVRVQWTYDARGRRTGVSDPDWTPASEAARYIYTWNGFDELIKQTDRIGNEQAMTYDGLGRLLTRKDYVPDGSDADYAPDLTAAATWTYDGAGNGLGQVQTVTDTESGYARAHTYDAHGRESITTLTIETAQYESRKKTYTTQQTYDARGRPYQFFDARLKAARAQDRFTDNVTEVHYNERGYAYQWTDGVYVSGKPRRTYREITSVDARGQVTGETLGGGVVSTRRTHDTRTGRSTGIAHHNALLREVQADTCGWDLLGNLSARTSVRGHHTVTESFGYDTLNRLTGTGAVHTEYKPRTRMTSTRTGAPQTVTYDALGNIISKSGVGAYSYDTRHPYAVSKTETTDNKTTTYFYDAMGNQLIGAGRTLDYTPFHKVKSIQKGVQQEVQFVYGPDRSRITRTDINRHNQGRSTTTTVYLGHVEHVIAGDGRSTVKRYLANGTVLITQDYDRLADRTGEDTCYLLKDHLGSLTTVLNKHGSLIQSFSYDAWGQRRNPDTAAILASLTLSSPIHSHTTTRGFTGHEMLDAVGIIHMNGRIYDPKLGRFLQADPVRQFPHYSQGQNAYSYVLNNPLTYTDPTGYFIGKLFRKVVGGLINGILGEFLSIKVPVLRQFFTLGHCLSGNAVVCASATAGNAYAGGASLKRSLKAGIFAYVSAQAFTAVGDAFAGTAAAGGANHLLAHAVTGGILAELQGGEFGHGFLSAGVAFGVGRIGEVRGWGVEAQFMASVVSAGTVSEVTGGKFANGATAAAFAFVYNHEKHRAERDKAQAEAERARKKRQVGEVYGRGDSLEFEGGNEIRVEPYSHTQGVDQFVYNVDYHYVDAEGNLVPMASALDSFGNPRPAYEGRAITGLGGGVPDRHFTAPVHHYRVRWYIRIPHQPATSGNSAGWRLRVYEIE